MTVKFINADIITMDKEVPVIEGGCVVTDGGKIIYCSGNAASGQYDRVIDCKGDILMPGLYNCHTHLAMSLLRGTAEEQSLQDWLYKTVFPVEKKLTAEDVYYGTMLSLAECVRGGITTVCDSYFFNGAAACAAQKCGVNMVLMGADMDVNQSIDSIINKIETDYQKYNTEDNKSISYIPGCHSVYTCSEQLLCAIADFANRNKCKTYIHLSETLKEVGDCTQQHNGLTPPQYLHKLGYFDHGAIAAHCVYVDKDDIALLKQSGVTAVICSGSNLKLASGIAPVHSMVCKELNTTLGTDGSASNNRLDIFREMYLTSVLQKGIMNNAEVLKPYKMLEMATVNAADALNVNNSAVIKTGCAADIIRINTNNPNFYPKNKDLSSGIVYSMLSSDVVMTMCGGKILYENGGYFLGEDIEYIYSQADKCKNRLLS